MTGWVFPECDLCGEREGPHILRLPHPEAPGGAAFIKECSGCGLKRLWPRPGEEIVQRYYDVLYGPDVGRQRSPLKQALWDLLRDGASGAPGRGKTIRILHPFLQIVGDYLFDINVSLDRTAPLRILDIGCGFGDLLLYWQSKGAEARGIDFDMRAVELARKLGLTVMHGDPLKNNITMESFDVVVLNHSLEHFPSPLAILHKVRKLLTSPGEVHIAVPNIASGGFQILRQNWEGIRLPVHFWFFEPETIIQLLKRAGFHNIRLMTKYPQQFFFSRLRDIRSVSKLRTFIEILKISVTRSDGGDTIKTIATA